MKLSLSWLFLLAAFIGPSDLAAQWYVAPHGSDTNPGTQEQPFYSIFKAHAVLAIGDTIYVAGGTYQYTITATLSKSGLATGRNVLIALPGDRPLLDFSSMATGSSNRGLRITGSFWYVSGLDIKGAGDNGLQMSGSENIVEHCSFFENRDSGVQLDNGAANNRFINCDSYHNADPTFENADGFAPKLSVGSGNVFVGCRAWENADDGWDGYLREANDVTTTLENCWSFRNGYLKDGTPSLPNGDGNGFKMGGSDDKTLRHNMILRRCLAFDNRVKGFDQNNNRGSMTILNGTSHRNGTNYSLPGPVDSTASLTLTNCVAFGPVGTVSASAAVTSSSWTGSSSVSEADFISIDTTGVRGPRQPDGSLPVVGFLRLAQGSDLIDAGTDVGLPYLGPAIDLGAFEYDPSTAVDLRGEVPDGFRVSQNYPNPFNPETRIEFTAPAAGRVVVAIHDLTGRTVSSEEQVIPGAGTYSFRWNAGGTEGYALSSGVYFATIRFGTTTRTVKMFFLK